MRYIILLAGVLGLDLGTKAWVNMVLPLGRRQKITKKHLYFHHIKNTGMAYHKLAGEKKIILTVTGTLTAIYGFLFFREMRKPQKNMAAPLAVTLGGALGNWLERAQKGYVTDFLYIEGKNAPIFNVADVALLVGALWMCILSFFEFVKKKNS